MLNTLRRAVRGAGSRPAHISACGAGQVGNLPHIARAFLPVFLLVSAAFAQPRYDLLLKHGHVIDPKNQISAIRDVAISQGKIAAVAQDIPALEARKTIDISSLYLTPGLVDMHTHV